jgi:hypothetical protein
MSSAVLVHTPLRPEICLKTIQNKSTSSKKVSLLFGAVGCAFLVLPFSTKWPTAW